MQQLFSKIYMEENDCGFFLKRSTQSVKLNNDYVRKVYTPEFLENNIGDEYLWEDSNEPITLKTILNSEYSVDHKYRFVLNKIPKAEQENKEIVLKVAEIVLSVYESKFPENKSPRELITACRSYMADKNKINLKELFKKRSDTIDALNDSASYVHNYEFELFFAPFTYADDPYTDSAYTSYLASFAVYPYYDNTETAHYKETKEGHDVDVSNQAFKVSYIDINLRKQLLDFLKSFIDK